MDLDPNFNGRWWIDCPNNIHSQGQTFGIAINNLVVFTLLTSSPRIDCPWTAFGNHTASTIDGDFDVADCTTNAPRGAGTFELRRR